MKDIIKGMMAHGITGLERVKREWSYPLLPLYALVPNTFARSSAPHHDLRGLLALNNTNNVSLFQI
jgi:hypothetical protein